MKLGGFYLRTAQVLPIYEVSARFSGPVSVIYGTNDQVVNPKYAKNTMIFMKIANFMPLRMQITDSLVNTKSQHQI